MITPLDVVPGSIRFLKLSLRDFRSWKSLDIPLVSQGATLLVGINGAGKSNIFSGLTWALFGKTAQGISPKDIVRRGSSACEASVSFVGLSGKVTIQRMRTATREFVRIYEETSSEEYGVQGGNKRVSTYLGMDWRTFMNTVFVGGGANRFFLMLPDGEKKRLLEDLLDMDRFRLGYGAASARVNHLKFRAEAMKTSAKMASHAIDRIDKSNKDIKAEELISNLYARTKRVQTQLLYLEKEVSKAASNRGSYVEDMEASLKDVDILREKLGETRYAVSCSEKNIQKLSRLGGKTCPECERELSKDEAEELIQRHRENVSLLSPLILDVEQKLSVLRDRVEEIQNCLNSVDTLISKRDSARERLQDLQEERDKSKSDLKKMSESQRNYFLKRLRSLQKTTEQIASILPYFQFWQFGFSQKGIKAEFLGRILPVLQNKSNFYLEKLSDDFSLDFLIDESGGFKTEIISSAFGETNYSSCSAGERRRLDLATSFALRDVVEEISGSSTNLSVLDEVIEGLDSCGSENFAEMLQNMSGNKSIFVVSHNAALVNVFDRVLTAEKSRGVSRLVI